MNNDYSPKQDQFRRLLVSLLDLPQAAPDNAEVALVLEVVDLALHTPPACADRLPAMGYFAQQARHLLGLTSVADLQQLLDQFLPTAAGDQQVAQLLWQRPEIGNVWALRLLVWFMMSYNVAERRPGSPGRERRGLRKRCENGWMSWGLSPRCCCGKPDPGAVTLRG